MLLSVVTRGSSWKMGFFNPHHEDYYVFSGYAVEELKK
jgi:hypothetical protein